MKSFKLLFVSLFLSSLSANSELNLDLKEYEIEVIIFKHINVITDENFNDEFTTPSIKTLSFYNPTLQINENAYLSKPKDNFFNRLFKDFNPIKKSINVLTKDKDISKVSNPKTWYRKTDNLVVLKKINNKLGTSSNYELLDSFKWIQNIDYKDDAQFLFYEDKQKEYGLYLKFYRSRFLHADLKSYLGVIGNDSIDITEDKIAKFQKKILEANKENNENLKNDLKIELNKPNKYVDINSNKIEPSLNISKSNEINIFIDEQRRIFNEEIHYFDHPMFGLIISVKEI